MIDTREYWAVRHFMQANPSGPGCDSVPALLRRLADSIEDDRARLLAIGHGLLPPAGRRLTRPGVER